MTHPRVFLRPSQLHDKTLVDPSERLTFVRSLSGNKTTMTITKADNLQGELVRLKKKSWVETHCSMESNKFACHDKAAHADTKEKFRIYGASITMHHAGSVEGQQFAFSFETLTGEKVRTQPPPLRAPNWVFLTTGRPCR